jgi:hypothetical protein
VSYFKCQLERRRKKNYQVGKIEGMRMGFWKKKIKGKGNGLG